MTCTQTKYFYDDWTVLFKLGCLFDIWPFDSSLTAVEQWNALVRLSIVVGVVMTIVWGKPLFLLIIAAAMGAAYFMTNGDLTKCLYGTCAQPSAQEQQLVWPSPSRGRSMVDNPYNNPIPYGPTYAKNSAMDVDRPGDDFIDKLYSGTDLRPPGFHFNQVPDPTLMARRPYALTSPDASTTPLGGWGGHPGSLAMRSF